MGSEWIAPIEPPHPVSVLVEILGYSLPNSERMGYSLVAVANMALILEDSEVLCERSDINVADLLNGPDILPETTENRPSISRAPLSEKRRSPQGIKLHSITSKTRIQRVLLSG